MANDHDKFSCNCDKCEARYNDYRGDNVDKESKGKALETKLKVAVELLEKIKREQVIRSCEIAIEECLLKIKAK